MNQYESMGIAESLMKAGYRMVDPHSSADFYIVNTCTVTGKTDRRSRHTVRRIMTWNPNAKIIVTGCGIERDTSDFKDQQGVILLIGNRDKMNIISYLEKLDVNACKIVVSPLKDATFQNIPITQFGGYTRAFLKIQDGCDGKCTYCIIPSVRGPCRSQLPENVRREVISLCEAGFNEIVLTGIHLGKYGIDLNPRENLLALLRQLININILHRLRLSSIEPIEFMKELIQLMITEPKICRHLHVPLQSGCDSILKRMGRHYSISDIEESLGWIKKKDPGFCVGADVIVAFPGETDEDFDVTYAVLKRLPVNYLHVFTFSPRPGTEAQGFTPRVDTETAKKRCHILRNLSQKKSIAFRQDRMESILTVIILASRDRESGLHIGLSDNYIRVLLKDNVPDPGTICDVKITKVDGLKCYGTIL